LRKKIRNLETSSLLACSAPFIPGDLDSVLLRASIQHEGNLWATLQTLATQAPVTLLHCRPRTETESKGRRQSSSLISAPKISRCSPMTGNKKGEQEMR